MKNKYQDRDFSKKSLELIEKINAVIDDYKQQHYTLTLRQCYYQLVSRGLIENTERSYKRITDLISNARLAGLIDWNSITDRTRYLRGGNGDSTPAERIRYTALGFSIDKWRNQKNYCEIWVEKDALLEVVGSACLNTDTRYFSCRGYCSQSEMHEAAQRFISKADRADCYLIYLGDFDPSGLDMTRDIKERLDLFGASPEIRRIALTQEQITKFNPPPNPAKITDKRAVNYIKTFGEYSWELDALAPQFIEQLIDSEVRSLMDDHILSETLALEKEQQRELQLLSDNYDAAINFLRS